MSGRAAMVGTVVGTIVLGLVVPSAFAGSMTTVGVFLQQFALDAQTILYGACAILFTGALIMAGAASYGGVTHLLGVPIYYAMLGSFGAGVVSVFINGVGLTQGATPEELVVASLQWGAESLFVLMLMIPAALVAFLVVCSLGKMESSSAE